MTQTAPIPAWLATLTTDELRFLKRFLVASGSLKELARDYEVSYPTIRTRAAIRALVRQDRLDVQTAREILAAYEKELI